MNLAQMERNPNVKIFWPANDKGERSALAIPYVIGLVQGRRRVKMVKAD